MHAVVSFALSVMGRNRMLFRQGRTVLIRNNRQVSEEDSYDYIPGFSKQIARTPAELELSKLPAGYGFQIQLQLTDSTENKSKPIIERLSLTFVN